MCWIIEVVLVRFQRCFRYFLYTGLGHTLSDLVANCGALISHSTIFLCVPQYILIPGLVFSWISIFVRASSKWAPRYRTSAQILSCQWPSCRRHSAEILVSEWFNNCQPLTPFNVQIPISLRDWLFELRIVLYFMKVPTGDSHGYLQL